MIVWPGLRRAFGTRSGIPIANRAVHFDAALGVTSAGGFASAWADQSGNARHLLQATGANQPIHLPFSGEKYGWVPGVSGNYFSTPDSVAASITGDIDIRVKAAIVDFTPASEGCLYGKWDAAGQRSFTFQLASSGGFILYWSEDGTAIKAAGATATLATAGLVENTEYLFRATLDIDNGASGNDAEFFYSTDDGENWTQIGATVTGVGATSIFDSTSALQVGQLASGSGATISGKIFSAQIYNGINGTLAVDFDPSRWTAGTTFTGSTGETWTINSTGSKPAQIVDRPSLLFDGAAHYMKCASFTLEQPYTIFAAGRQITHTVGDVLFDGNTARTAALKQTTSSARISLDAGSVVAENTEMALATRKVLCAVYNGASSSLQVTTGTPTTGNAGAGNASGFVVGADGASLNFGNGQWNEFLIYSAALDAATRANIISALMAKWSAT